MLDLKLGKCEKFTSDLGVDSDFALVVQFPLPLITLPQYVRENEYIKQNSK